MDRKALMNEWPKNANDLPGAVRLLEHGYPTLEPVLSDIVHQIKSSGPVAELFCKFLAELGEPAAEPVRPALKGTHDEQILKLLRDVMPNWSASALSSCAPELESLLQRGSVYGLHVFALALLVQAQTETHAPAYEWARLLRERLNAQLAVLDEIDRKLGV